MKKSFERFQTFCAEPRINNLRAHSASKRGIGSTFSTASFPSGSLNALPRQIGQRFCLAIHWLAMRDQSKGILQIMLVLIGVSYACWYSRDQPWTFTRVAGLVLAIPALLAWMTARIQLGPSFAIRAKAKELVTHGLYSKIRNPIYLFGSIFIVGLLLLIGKPAWLLTLVVLVPMQVFRARKEAKVLEEKFGDAYRDYRGKTWF